MSIQCIYYKGHLQYCHMGVEQPYEIQSYVSQELAEEWLNMLAKAEKFKWTVSIEGRPGIAPRYLIELKDYSHGYRTMIGSLIKGIGEHHQWCRRHMEDSSNDPFFVKSARAFDAQCETGETRHFCGSHIWWEYYMTGMGEKYKRRFNSRIQTVEELFEQYRKRPVTQSLWRTYLLDLNKPVR